MTAALSAAHLLRRFLLFALTVLFLLTLLRAGYALWHFPTFASSKELIALFVQGLRFDLALVGLLLLPVTLIGPLLGMFRSSLALARVLIVALLMLALSYTLLAEFVSPWFIGTGGVRPGLAEWRAMQDPFGMIVSGARTSPVPTALGALLVVLVLVAFWTRLEIPRLLTYPIRKGSAVMLMLFGTSVCVLAIWSGIPSASAPLGPDAARISDSAALNELALNTGYKLVAPVLTPMLDAFTR